MYPRRFNGSDKAQARTVGWKGAKSLLLAKTDLWGNGVKPIAPSLSLVSLEIMTLPLQP